MDHATAVAWKNVDVPLYQGVTFFFVLSGFILAYTYPELPDWNSVKQFWLARFARIWPGYFASVIFVFLILPFTFDWYWSAKGALQMPLVLVLIQAWIPRSDYNMAVSGVAWSISVEAFFYVLFPLLIKNFSRTWPIKLAASFSVVLAMVFAVWWLKLPTYARKYSDIAAGGLIYSFPLTRLFEFVLGMTAALAFRSHRQRLELSFGAWQTATLLEVFIVSLIVAQFFVGPNWYEWFGPLPIYVNNGFILWLERSGSAPLYALLLFVFAFERGAISRIVRTPILVLYGEISYSIYLLHQTAIRWLSAHAIIVALNPWMLWPVYAVAVLALSYIWWAFIERPARKFILSKFGIRRTEPIVGYFPSPKPVESI